MATTKKNTTDTKASTAKKKAAPKKKASDTATKAPKATKASATKTDSAATDNAVTDSKGMTFDIYHYFSRHDVRAVIILIAILLLYVLFKAIFAPEIV